MKLSTNLISSATWPVWPFVIVVWLTALGCAAATYTYWIGAQETRVAKEKLTASIERLRESRPDENSANIQPPTDNELAQLAKDISFFNTMSGPLHAPAINMLQLMEETIPPKVWISQLSYSMNTGRLVFSMQAEKEVELPEALKMVEQAKDLRNVILQRQTRVQLGNLALVQYDIEAVLE